MNVMILNFNESPENYHLEMALTRVLIKKGYSFLKIHNYKHNYSKLSTLPNPEINRINWKEFDIKSYDSDILISIDFPWKIDSSSVFYLNLIKKIKKPEIMITNHLLPVKGQSDFYDTIINTNFFKLFEKTYIFEFEDESLWPEKINTVIKRKYYIDSEYYKPVKTEKKAKKITIFSAGAKGRDYNSLIYACGENVNLKILTNVNIKPSPNVEIFRPGANLFNFKKIISQSDFTVIPISDNELNQTAGLAMAFISMAMAKPVLIRRTTYTEKYIKDSENGFLYNSISELKSHIKRIINQKEKLHIIGRNARKTIEEKASLDSFAQMVIEENI